MDWRDEATSVIDSIKYFCKSNQAMPTAFCAYMLADFF